VEHSTGFRGGRKCRKKEGGNGKLVKDLRNLWLNFENANQYYLPREYASDERSGKFQSENMQASDERSGKFQSENMQAMKDLESFSLNGSENILNSLIVNS